MTTIARADAGKAVAALRTLAAAAIQAAEHPMPFLDVDDICRRVDDVLYWLEQYDASIVPCEECGDDVRTSAAPDAHRCTSCQIQHDDAPTPKPISQERISL